MGMPFFKYQGTGNDFVMIDHRKPFFDASASDIAALCDRRFGIGADGLILLEPHERYHFRMVYYNSDGRESTMCGNGGRCAVAFAVHLGIVPKEQLIRFEAIDGYHEAHIMSEIDNGYMVDLKMSDVNGLELHENTAVLNTGSPHYVALRHDIETIDIVPAAHEIRYGERFKNEGINVNFIEREGENIRIRTYERGVEDETYSCGTGIVAAAIAISEMEGTAPAKIIAPGGELQVRFTRESAGKYSDIHLTGPARMVFKGEW